MTVLWKYLYVVLMSTVGSTWHPRPVVKCDTLDVPDDQIGMSLMHSMVWTFRATRFSCVSSCDCAANECRSSGVYGLQMQTVAASPVMDLCGSVCFSYL
jgi:hypothetical protein